MLASSLAARGWISGGGLKPVSGDSEPRGAVWLEHFDISKADQEIGTPAADKSVNGNPITLDGVVYIHGFGAHAAGELELDLDSAAERFVARVGLDDECAGKGPITFEIRVDGKRVAETPVLRGGGDSRTLDVDLRGAMILRLVVTNGGDNNYFDDADWAGAYLLVKAGEGGRIHTLGVVDDPPPDIHHEPRPEPAIHGPRVVGATPGNPFLFRIPATGEHPLRFAVENLPPDLTLDEATGTSNTVGVPTARSRRTRVSRKSSNRIA